MRTKLTGGATIVAWCGFFLAVVQAADATNRLVALFDESHGQRFLAGRDGPLDLSRFAQVLADQRFEITTTGRELTDQELAGAGGLVISGAFKPLTEREVEAVTRFVERGGRLCIMLHIGPPVAGLLHRLHTSISNAVIFEQDNIVENTPANFRVTRLRPHELTRGMKGFSIFGGWALLNTRDTIVAETSPGAWIDLNGDAKRTEGDAVQSFAVVVTGNLGRGRFVVFGDDAIFQNQFLKEGNLLLAKNLAAWLSAISS